MRACLIALLVLLCLPAAAVAAGPEIHAHRGGSVLAGVPTFGEETMPAFRYAWEVERAVLELDVKLTSDRVPVVIHDDTLDRTTDCAGAVSSVTAAQFAACRVDVLGSGGSTAPAPVPIPTATLAEVLAYARDSGARLNLEIKNLPGDNDFDVTSAYATTVIDAIKASGFPVGRLIVQSFWPANLDVAAAQLPGAAALLPDPGRHAGRRDHGAGERLRLRVARRRAQRGRTWRAPTRPAWAWRPTRWTRRPASRPRRRWEWTR